MDQMKTKVNKSSISCFCLVWNSCNIGDSYIVWALKEFECTQNFTSACWSSNSCSPLRSNLSPVVESSCTLNEFGLPHNNSHVVWSGLYSNWAFEQLVCPPCQLLAIMPWDYPEGWGQGMGITGNDRCIAHFEFSVDKLTLLVNF